MDGGTARRLGLKNLVDATRKITSRLDMDSVLGQIVRSLTEDLGGVFAAVWIVEHGDRCHNCDMHEECLDKNSCLHLKAWSGGNDKNPGVAERIPLGVMKIGTIGLSKSPYLANDITNDPMILDRGWFNGSGIKSFAGFPLLHAGELFGVMTYFGETELSCELGDMLLCLAHQSAMAVVDAEAHRKVIESEERYRALIDGAIDAVLILGPDGRILASSQSATRHFGFNHDELSAMSIKDLDLGSFEIFKDSYPSLLAGETVTYSGIFITKSGNPLPVEVKAGATIYDGDTAVQAFVRDITDRVKMEKHKSDVVSMLTHDLKGPISVIVGYSEIIKEQYWDDVPEFVKEGIHSMHKAGDRLISLVNDYLSLSRMESGTLVMKREPTRVKALIERGLETIALRAREKELDTGVDCDPDVPDIEVDPLYMERAVTNLLINAVSYTPRGGKIIVSCAMSGGGGKAEITVSDTGVGIPEDELPLVFEKYYRAAGGKTKGTGLGLAIVKAVVEGHGGTVEAESVEGKGSTFRIIVPAY